MTVKELIEELSKIKDKSKRVMFEYYDIWNDITVQEEVENVDDWYEEIVMLER